MSKPSNKPRSGLSTVVRDFSNSQELSQGSKASQGISWPPSSPPRHHSAKPLTPHDIRMKAIQDGIAEFHADKKTVSVPVAPLRQSSLNKRASPSNDATQEPKPKKSRKLPADFHDVVSQPKRSTARPLNPPSKGSTSSSNNDLSAFKTSPPNAGLLATKSDLPSPFLSPEQKKILALAKSGASLFYTGSAGTGKSVLLRDIIKALRSNQKQPDTVAITASTGIAACNIGGTTIHSFAGFGLGEGSIADLVAKIKKNRKSTLRWTSTKVLVIDEVSMVDGDLFDKLAKIGSAIRRDPRPFGGIQVIVTGDFFQLPPVTKSGSVKFAFEAETWSQAVQYTFNLTKVFRQSDQTFVGMLNEMRFGTLSQESIARFQALRREIVYDDGIGATELYPRRENVDMANAERLRRLPTKSRRYSSIDGGEIKDPAQRERGFANFMAAQTLELRVDAQVMLIKNHDDTLVNGSLGRVIRFVDPGIYSTEADKEAMPGEVGIIGASNTTTGVGAAGKKSQSSGAAVSSQEYPVVEFVLARGGRRRMLVMPEVWKVEEPNGKVQLIRTQLPLILSWAMSIHKSQGQTLDRVKVDLGKIFEKGQAYVALSRATSLDGLQVLNFTPAKVMAHPKVIEWSKSLSTIDDN